MGLKLSDAEEWTRSSEGGVRVDDVLELLPAEKAGIERGDLITKVTHTRITRTRFAQRRASTGLLCAAILLRSLKLVLSNLACLPGKWAPDSCRE